MGRQVKRDQILEYFINANAKFWSTSFSTFPHGYYGKWLKPSIPLVPKREFPPLLPGFDKVKRKIISFEIPRSHRHTTNGRYQMSINVTYDQKAEIYKPPDFLFKLRPHNTRRHDAKKTKFPHRLIVGCRIKWRH